jgi:hypothetical protein
MKESAECSGIAAAVKILRGGASLVRGWAMSISFG